MRARRLVALAAVFGSLVVGCELIAGLHDRALEACDACVDATPDVPTTCTSPKVTCNADAANATCTDLTTDPSHCGSCAKACPYPDAGAFDATTGNPDSGIPTLDGAATDATYVSAPVPTCEGGACGAGCPGSMALCSDGLCYDTSSVHDHCGSCAMGCDGGSEWCTSGHCCATGMEYCSGACIDVLADPSNCGGCGIKCTGSTPTCVAGTCGAGVVFTDTFTQNVAPSAQICTDWTNFRALLSGTYTSITVRGTFDSVGHTCTGATANVICQALHTGATVAATLCNGNMWAVDTCTGIELTASGSACACQTPGWDLRPCLPSASWGGVNTTTCTAPTQTMTVICQ